MKSKRIKWLDFGKGFTILFVVLFHCIQSSSPHSVVLLNLLGTFIMPVFFAISGYLYKSISSKKDYFLLFYKKSFSFIMPFIIFCIITFYLNDMNLLSFTPWAFHAKHIYDVIFMINGTGAYLWFLYYLFFIFIVIGSFDYFIKGKKLFYKIVSFINIYRDIYNWIYYTFNRFS